MTIGYDAHEAEDRRAAVRARERFHPPGDQHSVGGPGAERERSPEKTRPPRPQRLPRGDGERAPLGAAAPEERGDQQRRQRRVSREGILDRQLEDRFRRT